MSLATMTRAVTGAATGPVTGPMIGGATRAVTGGTSPAALDGIQDPEVALAIWHRDLPCDVQAALATIDFDEVDDIGVVLSAGEAPHDALRDAGYPDAAIDPIAADLAALLHRHAALTGAGRLALRLEVVETDACRRFHADRVTVRMISTYVGPGTQWHHVADPDAIDRLATGTVAVFKGRLLLDPPTVLHRSPPITATGERRLVLAIDPA
jgi:hypothetical protein